MLVDTHCHLHDRQFFTEDQAEEAIKKASKNGVKKIICIGTGPEDSLAAQSFAISHKNVFYTIGVHPSESEKALGTDFFEEYKHMFSKASPIAIGEIGLDYHYEPESRDQQIKLFEQMLQIAKDLNLPVSFHIREAFDDFFGIISNFPEIKGVVHSFSDSKKNLKRILNETDFYIGVNGLATYSTLPTPPLERTLLETDAPFLAPVPFRGQTNEPAYIKNIADWLSEKLQETPEKIAKITTKNAETLFHLPK